MLGEEAAHGRSEGVEHRRSVLERCPPMSRKIDCKYVVVSREVLPKPFHVKAIAAPTVHEDQRPLAALTRLIEREHQTLPASVRSYRQLDRNLLGDMSTRLAHWPGNAHSEPCDRGKNSCLIFLLPT